MRTSTLLLLLCVTGCTDKANLQAKDREIAELKERLAASQREVGRLGAVKPPPPSATIPTVTYQQFYSARVREAAAMDDETQKRRLAAFRSALIAASGDDEVGWRAWGQVITTLHAQSQAVARTVGHEVLDAKGHLKDPLTDARVVRDRALRVSGRQGGLHAMRNLYGPEAGSLIVSAELPE